MKSEIIRPWDSIPARWRLTGRPKPTLRPGPDARLMPKSSEDAERLIGDWNERQARRMPLLFAPMIGAARPSDRDFAADLNDRVTR
jgi:hypothetical protein